MNGWRDYAYEINTTNLIYRIERLNTKAMQMYGNILYMSVAVTLQNRI